MICRFGIQRLTHLVDISAGYGYGNDAPQKPRVDSRPSPWIGVAVHVLTPGRYVGGEEIGDDGIPFEEKMAELPDEVYGPMAEAGELHAAIRRNPEVLGYGE